MAIVPVQAEAAVAALTGSALTVAADNPAVEVATARPVTLELAGVFTISRAHELGSILV
jgi:hypothetical protein